MLFFRIGGPLAQLVEHLTFNERVAGSSPARLIPPPWTRHPLIGASLMDVHVENGEVTITGEVLDRRMKHMTEDVIDDVTGVKEVW